METIVKKIKTASGKVVTLESNQFTEEELQKMPASHRKAILGFRGLAEWSAVEDVHRAEYGKGTS